MSTITAPGADVIVLDTPGLGDRSYLAHAEVAA